MGHVPLLTNTNASTFLITLQSTTFNIHHKLVKYAMVLSHFIVGELRHRVVT